MLLPTLLLNVLSTKYIFCRPIKQYKKFYLSLSDMYNHISILHMVTLKVDINLLEQFKTYSKTDT